MQCFLGMRVISGQENARTVHIGLQEIRPCTSYPFGNGNHILPAVQFSYDRGAEFIRYLLLIQERMNGLVDIRKGKGIRRVRKTDGGGIFCGAFLISIAQ